MAYEISRHAEKRIKERLGIKRKAQQRMIKKVEDEGLTHHYMKGNLFKWVSGKLYSAGLRGSKGTKGIIYDSNLFLVRNDIVITVIPIPSNLNKLVNDSFKKRGD